MYIKSHEPRIPLEKIHKYDEDLLLKLRDEENALMKKRKTKINMDIEYNDVGNTDYISPIQSISCIDTFDPVNVMNLIKETKDLSQQTNTITQAILLNMPLIKPEINANSKAILDEEMSSNQYSLKSYTSKSIDINSNASYKPSPSEINAFEPIRNEPASTNYRESPFECRSSVFSSVSQQTSFDDRMKLESRSFYADRKRPKKFPSEIPERPPSILSSYCQSTYESTPKNKMEVIASENNGRASKMEFDKQSVGGTLYLTRVSNNDSNSSKNNNAEKSPSKFVTEMSNNSAITSTFNESKIGKFSRQGTDEGYSTAKTSMMKVPSTLSLAPSMAPLNVSAFTVIKLSERSDGKLIHIFHLDEEGWVVASEMVNAFTNLKDQRVMFKLLKILEYQVKYKHITRETEAELFSQLDQSKLKAPRDENNVIKEDFVLILLSLKSVLQILVKLDFLNSKMVKDAVPLIKQRKENLEEELFELFENKILYDVMNLPGKYSQFKRSLRMAKK